MRGRDIDEQHRVSTPLELLFDLTFVVAVAQVAAQLAHSIAAGNFFSVGIAGYLMVFFAIWWSWVNFTWFASAYDTDDAAYRLLTLVQIGGVLVLAAGVPNAFSKADYSVVTLGYLLMRVGLVCQWIRAAKQHPAGRATAYRYAAGIGFVQVLWVARLFLPASLALPAYFLVLLLDVCVPLWAERRGRTPWHPHHIAERYGLFTIILFGESVSAIALAVQAFMKSSAVSADLILVAAAGLVLIFALWWLYFDNPAGEGLGKNRKLAFFWGYSHYFLFVSVAAIGAGLEAAIDSGSPEFESPIIVVAYVIAIPVACFFAMLYILNLPTRGTTATRSRAIAAAIVLVLLVPLAAPLAGIAVTVTLTALIAAMLVAVPLLAPERARSGVAS